MDTKPAFNDLLENIIKERDADIFVFSADITFENSMTLIQQVQNAENKKPHCALLLTTYGGDPDAAYRMIKTIKRFYKKIILFVYGPCKSAGTLMALGADEIIMGLMGEFGPLDIQLTKDDEFITNTSGVSYLQMLDVLNEKLFSTFEDSFLKIKHRSRYAITTKTAGEICSSLAVGLLSPISGQIDPLKLGDIQRAINITYAYGMRLGATKDTLDRLILGYPSHSFVIDIDEAAQIFNTVKSPTLVELQFEQFISNIVRFVPEKPVIQQVIPEKKQTQNDTPNTNSNGQQQDDSVGADTKGNGASVKQQRKQNQKDPSAN